MKKRIVYTKESILLLLIVGAVLWVIGSIPHWVMIGLLVALCIVLHVATEYNKRQERKKEEEEKELDSQ
ncbi:MAG: hypothetical protein JSV08_06565 [Acidobacteriota bacterium]|nr:MAG: hypothetical protein JSV08_06565 [Acidobacteriota bacterium]